MRIGLNLLYLLPGLVGGTQTYAMNLMAALAAIDSENEYILFLNRECADLDLPAAPNFKRVDCPINAVSRGRRYLWEQFVLPQRVRQSRVQLLHSLGYVGPVVTPCPHLVTIHDVNFVAVGAQMPVARRYALGAMVKSSARFSSQVLTVSEYSKQEIVKYLSVAANKVTVTHEGPAALRAPLTSAVIASVQSRYGIEQKYLLAFSSPSPHKNIARLIDAFRQIAQNVPHSLVLVGHPPDGVDLQRKIATTALEHRIIYTGYVPDDDVMPLLQGAELFTFPSTYEGFGLPILDAQQLHVPVASSRAASLPEVAGEGAAFFDPVSTDEIAKCLLRCLVDEPYRQCLITKGQSNVARFSWERTARETLETYRLTLGRSS